MGSGESDRAVQGEATDGGQELTQPGRPPRLTPIILLEAANFASGVGNAITEVANQGKVVDHNR